MLTGAKTVRHRFRRRQSSAGLQNSWHSSAACMYRNWLQYLESRKTEAPAFAAMGRVTGSRSAVRDGETAS
jgi:hypothetical protein